MPPNSWKQWIKLTKKQIKQLRRSLDDELQGLLERNVPRPSRSLVRVPVPARQVYPVRNSYRNIYTAAGSAARGATDALKVVAPRASARASAIRGSYVNSAVLSNFSGMQRCPRGVPRGLFSNWNMTTARYASGRAYSTSAIHITHDAVQNMAISLRCFFNLWDGFLPSGQESNYQSIPLSPSQSMQRLDSRGVSTLRDMELYNMIQEHKQLIPNEYQVEDIGCVVDFKLPELDLSSLPVIFFACEESMGRWTKEINLYRKKLKQLEESVRYIYEQYGSLPLSFDSQSIRIHFPNLTIQETERLLRDAGISLGVVLRESDILSEVNEFTPDPSEQLLALDSMANSSPFFPILSSASDSEFSLVSSPTQV